MKNAFRASLAAVLLLVTPACASIRAPDIPNPIAVAQTNDQRALAVIETYAALVEEAADVVANPQTPAPVRRALAQAEAAATPAVDILRIAVTGYLRAQADLEAMRGKERTSVERASAALAVAGVRLADALTQARAPMAALSRLLIKEKNQ